MSNLSSFHQGCKTPISHRPLIIDPGIQTPGSMFPDTLTHRRVFYRMLALPPDEIVQVATERKWRALHAGNGNTIFKSGAALVANPAVTLLWRHDAVPGNAPVPILIKAGRINGPDWLAGARMPVLAVGPVIDQHSEAANLTERQLALIRCRISPYTMVAAIEAASSAIVGSAVWHKT